MFPSSSLFDFPLSMLAETADALQDQGPELDAAFEVVDMGAVEEGEEQAAFPSSLASSSFYEPFFGDHNYERGDADYDRIVNSHHDYYGRINQSEFEGLDGGDHSYAYLLPLSVPLLDEWPPWDEEGGEGIERRVEVEEELLRQPEEEEVECRWGECRWRGPQSSADVHFSSVHLPGYGSATVHECRWKGCTRRLAKRYLLSRHVRIHYGTMAAACDECGRQFRTTERMRLHTLAVHGKRAAPTTESEIRRMRDMPVLVASAPRPSQSSVPTGHRRLLCTNQSCSRTFTTASERIHHERRAHGVAVTCPDCSGSFANSLSLYQHRRRMHK